MPDLILLNGDLRTQDPARPRARALAVRSGRILALGDDDRIRPLASPETEVIDLAGRLVLPGLTDSHFHYYDWALSRRQLNLGQAASLDELLGLVARAAAERPAGAWIIGRGLDESDWPEPRLPVKAELDAAAPDHPVLLFRRDMHLALLSSRALALAGIDDSTPDPPEGVIERDRAGRATGLLREQAMNLAGRAVPQPGEEETADALAEAMPALHALGLTGLHDARLMGGLDGPPALRAWQRLRESGRLKLRCWSFLPGERLDEVIALGLRTGLGDDLLRLGHLKYFADGSIGSKTAWLIEPYLNGGLGLPLTPVEDIARAARRAEEAGLAVAVHAIGDRANRELVGVFEELARRRTADGVRPAAPHRLEHVQMIRPEDVVRLGRLGVVASVQPLHLSDDITVHDQGLGDRGRWVYPFKGLLEAGLTLAFGSDCPVSDPNPLWGVHAAVTRQRRDGSPAQGWYPAQRLSVAEAVRAYTLGPALACGREADLGSLSPGKLADLIVLDRDIYSIEPADIHRARVDLTVFDGRVVFRR